MLRVLLFMALLTPSTPTYNNCDYWYYNNTDGVCFVKTDGHGNRVPYTKADRQALEKLLGIRSAE